MKLRWLGVVVALALCTPSMSAQRPIVIGLGGGASQPLGDFADAAELGWHALAVISLESIMLPQSLRADIGYGVFPFKDVPGSDGNHTVGSATVNLGYRLPMTDSPFSPYILTGFGWYQLGCDQDCEKTIVAGWNAGLGTKFIAMGLNGFIESRFHYVYGGPGSATFVPVTIGFRL